MRLASFIRDMPARVSASAASSSIPGMRQEGSLRPAQHGIALAKDSWASGGPAWS